MRTHVGRIIAGTVAATVLSGTAMAKDASYLSLSLEDLTNIEVTSVSKKSEKASEAAAAIFVITNEDIRRTGATSIAEALRMVPGMQVAKGGSAQWAVSSRGFNDQFANKLLVLLDGRSVYTPNFSGVWWDVQNVLLEDVERIEVIRGPGAALWGANAVNGVINVITKEAKDTQGSFITAGGGSNRLAFGSARHGGTLGDNGHYRIYAKHDQWDEGRFGSGKIGQGDEWNISQAGFRSDIKADKTSLTIQGDAYTSEQEQDYALPVAGVPYTRLNEDTQTVLGANLMAKWSRVISERSTVSFNSYIDFAQRDVVVVEMDNTTIDFDFQHDYAASDWHDFTWGMGVRYLSDQLNGTPYLRFVPDSSDRIELNAFMQSKLEVLPDWTVTLGQKLEYNEFTELEYQPSIRSAYLIDDKQTLWGAVSRAVRTPSRSARDLVNVTSAVPALANGLAIRYGNNNTESEELIAYELGYRAQPYEDVALDVTAFYNDYSNMIFNQIGTPFVVPADPTFGLYTQLPVTLVNGAEASTYGFEAAFNYNPFAWWKLGAGYNFIKVDVAGQTLPTGSNSTPQHQANLRSYLQLAEGVQFDQALYYVDEINPTTTISIPDYFRLDLRLAMQLKEHLELTLVGQNLLDPEHPEFSPFLYNNLAQVPRSVYGQLRWDF